MYGCLSEINPLLQKGQIILMLLCVINPWTVNKNAASVIWGKQSEAKPQASSHFITPTVTSNEKRVLQPQQQGRIENESVTTVKPTVVKAPRDRRRFNQRASDFSDVDDWPTVGGTEKKGQVNPVLTAKQNGHVRGNVGSSNSSTSSGQAFSSEGAQGPFPLKWPAPFKAVIDSVTWLKKWMPTKWNDSTTACPVTYVGPCLNLQMPYIQHTCWPWTQGDLLMFFSSSGIFSSSILRALWWYALWSLTYCTTVWVRSASLDINRNISDASISCINNSILS
jgi:hypothetical protein